MVMEEQVEIIALSVLVIVRFVNQIIPFAHIVMMALGCQQLVVVTASFVLVNVRLAQEMVLIFNAPVVKMDFI